MCERRACLPSLDWDSRLLVLGKACRTLGLMHCAKEMMRACGLSCDRKHVVVVVVADVDLFGKSLELLESSCDETSLSAALQP